MVDGNNCTSCFIGGEWIKEGKHGVLLGQGARPASHLDEVVSNWDIRVEH